MIDVLETIKAFGGAASQFTAIIALCALFIKPIRKKFISWIKKESGTVEIDKIVSELADDIKEIKEKLDKQEEQLKDHIETSKQGSRLARESDLFELRQHINEIYLHYFPLKRMPIEVRENLIKGFEIYKKMGGNSYIEKIVNELLNLPVEM